MTWPPKVCPSCRYISKAWPPSVPARTRLASSPNTNAAKVFLNWVLSREGQIQFQKLTHENSLRVDIPKEGVVHPYYILDPKREYLFTGLEEYKDKINEFRPWLESLVTKK
jgi:ABC-type Fe3+ transport system substrate-binding protein